MTESVFLRHSELLPNFSAQPRRLPHSGQTPGGKYSNEQLPFSTLSRGCKVPIANRVGHTNAPAGTACPSGAAQSAWPNRMCFFCASMPVPVLPPAGQSANPCCAVPSASLGHKNSRGGPLTWMKWEAVLLETIIASSTTLCQVVAEKLQAR